MIAGPEKRYTESWQRPVDFLTRTLGAPVNDLPTLPEVAAELLRLVNDNDYDIKNLVRIIAKDPPLTARLLKLANSPLFRVEHKIVSLSRAVVLLGMNEIRNLALSLTIFESAAGGENGLRNENRRRLWKHSLIVGLLAETLAAEEFSLGPGYYVYGLIHDIGKVIIDAHLPNEFSGILTEMTQTGQPWPVIEKKRLGFDHAVIGQALLDYWGLPESMSQAVGWHHQPWRAGKYQETAGILFMANLFAKMLGYHSFINEGEIELRRILTMQAVRFLTHLGWTFDGRLIKRLESRVNFMLDNFDPLA